MWNRLIIVTSALALMAGTISSADAHWRGGRGGRSRVIIQQQAAPAVGVGLAAILGLGLLAQQNQKSFVVEDEPSAPPRRFVAPPSEPKLRNPIPMK